MIKILFSSNRFNDDLEYNLMAVKVWMKFDTFIEVFTCCWSLTLNIKQNY